MTYTLAKSGDNTVGGTWPGSADFPGGPSPHWMVCWAVSDTDAAAATVSKNGGTVDMEPFDSPYGRIAVVHDPWGAGFSVMGPNAG
jgi:predicted enzyme related to lactoylglutathione lyase